MTSTFSLLKLPLLPIESILINISLPELIHFSMISKRCYKLVNDLRIKFLTSLDLHVTKESTCIKFKSRYNILGGWHFLSHKGNEDEEKKQVNRSIGGCEMKTFILDDHIYSFTRYDAKISVRVGSEYIMNLFKRKQINNAYLYSDEISGTMCPYFYPFKEFNCVIIIGKMTMYNDDLKYLLSTVTAKYGIRLALPIKRDFSFDEFKFQGKYLSITQNAHWITSEMFHNFNVDNLRLYRCKLTSKDCQLFVRQWFDSDNTTFNTMILSFLNPPVVDDFSGFELLPFDKKRRRYGFKSCAKNYIDCTNGFDVIRSNGLLATILIGPFWFIFHVWHDRFPDLDGLINFIN